MFFLCGVFLIMYLVTATTTASPVAVVHFWASPITMTVTMAVTSVDLAALGQCDMVLPPQLILRDTRGMQLALPLYCNSNSLNPKCLLRHMPIIPWVLLQ